MLMTLALFEFTHGLCDGSLCARRKNSKRTFSKPSFVDELGISYYEESILINYLKAYPLRGYSLRSKK